MIIYLKGADFSARPADGFEPIGTLNSWMVRATLGHGATSSNTVTSVEKDAAYSTTITIAEGYKIGAAGVSVTMGGQAVSVNASTNPFTISIAKVTGTIVIKVPTAAIATNNMSISGTWTFKETIGQPQGQYNNLLTDKFDTIHNDDGELSYIKNGAQQIVYTPENGWIEDSDRTFTVEGTQIISAELYNWITDNAVKTGDTKYTITYQYMCNGSSIKTATTEQVSAGTTKIFSTSSAPAITGYTVSSVSPTSATIDRDITVTYTYAEVSKTELTLLNTFPGQIDKSNVGTKVITGKTNTDTHTSSKYLLPAGTAVTINVQVVSSASSFAITDKDDTVVEIVSVNNGPVDGTYTFKAYSEDLYLYVSNKYLLSMTGSPSTLLNLVPSESIEGHVTQNNTVGSEIQFATGAGTKAYKYSIPAGAVVTLVHVNGGNYGFAMTNLDNIITEYVKTDPTKTATDQSTHVFNAPAQNSYLYLSASKVVTVTMAIN